jgi:hypothetical protein
MAGIWYYLEHNACHFRKKFGGFGWKTQGGV